MNEYNTAWSSSLGFALGALLLAGTGYAAGSEQHPTGMEYSVGPFRLDSVKWSEPYAGPLGVPKGAQRAILGTDPKTNGDTYYAHFPAGSRFELHWHAYAEYAVVLRGKVTHILGTKRSSLDVGDYVVIPPNVNHGWEVNSTEDVYLLIRRDGPADQNFVRP